MSFHDRLSCVPCNIRPLALVPLPTSSSSSSASWPSLQRSRCFTTTTLRGPRSWDTALECPHSSVCLLIWCTTCSMPRAHSNRYHTFFLVSSFAFLSAWFLLISQHLSLSFAFLPYPLFSHQWFFQSCEASVLFFPCNHHPLLTVFTSLTHIQ